VYPIRRGSVQAPSDAQTASRGITRNACEAFVEKAECDCIILSEKYRNLAQTYKSNGAWRAFR
jgi:hypothetical protein